MLKRFAIMVVSPIQPVMLFFSHIFYVCSGVIPNTFARKVSTSRLLYGGHSQLSAHSQIFCSNLKYIFIFSGQMKMYCFCIAKLPRSLSEQDWETYYSVLRIMRQEEALIFENLSPQNVHIPEKMMEWRLDLEKSHSKDVCHKYYNPVVRKHYDRKLNIT